MQHQADALPDNRMVINNYYLHRLCGICGSGLDAVNPTAITGGVSCQALKFTTMHVRVLLVDDHILFRQALSLLLSSEPGIEIVGELGDGSEVEAALARLTPDVIVMDVGMPGVNGIDATRALLARDPARRVLMLSAHSSPKFVAELLEMGALGYVVKSGSSESLVDAIRAVAAGEVYCSAQLQDELALLPDRSELGLRAHRPLGTREREVLCLLAQGRSSPQIAQAIGIAPSTVDVHRRNVMGKLQLHSVAELTQYAIRTGMISV
jgi:two-component system NarL family response regulator